MLIFFAFITTLVYITNLTNLKIVKLDGKNIVIMAGLNFVVITLSLAFAKPLGAPATLILIILYLNRIKKEYMKNIILAILTIFIAFMGDAIAGIVILKIFNISKEQLINNLSLYILLHFMVLSVSFIISKGLGYLLNKIQLSKINSKFIKLFLINLFVGLFMIYTIGNIYKFSQKDNAILILNLVLLIIYFSLVAYIAKIYVKVSQDEIKYKYKDKQLQQLKEYTEMIETTNEDMRKFKHDYLNILSTINGYTENGDLKGLKEYLHNYIMPISMDISNKNMSFNNLKNIKVTEIKGLLSYKIGQAQKYNINIVVDILEGIDSISINIVDLCRMLGIFLDNAIEEAKNCEDKQIIICIVKKNYTTTIAIANTCSENIPPIYKMIEKGFSTKGDNRGLGLNTVNEIINTEYVNVTLNTYVEKKLFKQELVIEDLD